MTIRSFKRWGNALAVALVAMTVPHPSFAQTAASYPNKPVKLVVSFPPSVSQAEQSWMRQALQGSVAHALDRA